MTSTRTILLTAAFINGLVHGRRVASSPSAAGEDPTEALTQLILGLGPAAGFSLPGAQSRVPQFHRSPPAIMRTGWDSPNWNWGSAVGEAHDEAMRVRSAFGDEASRKTFQDSLYAGTADMFDAKLVLALSCQRARNLGYDDNGKPWEKLMDRMATGEFEVEDGDDSLRKAIDRYFVLFCGNVVRHKTLGAAIGDALDWLEFVDRGL